MADDLNARCQELIHRLLAPLVLGGTIHPVRPFGGPLGLRIGVGHEIVDLDLRSRIDVARVRRARLLAPVDTLPPLDEVSFALLAALNDILQLTNHELAGIFTRRRYHRLLTNLHWICDRIPAPRDLQDALCRHAIFARVLEIVRTDTKVSWWTGSASFRGAEPPKRLLAWRELRRVHVDEDKVPIYDMVDPAVAVSEGQYLNIFSHWLTLTPITDLATATRKAPSFAWTAATLAIIATPPGRGLALRAFLGQPKDLATAVLSRAAREIPDHHADLRAAAERFAADLAIAFKSHAPHADAG